MSDLIICLTSCRQDGRCPECGNFAPPADPRHRLACRCETHDACTVAHANDLLTAALRQRDAATAAVTAHEAELHAAEIDKDWANERADRAEALLRECQQYMGGLGLGRRGQELLAKIRESLQ